VNIPDHLKIYNSTIPKGLSIRSDNLARSFFSYDDYVGLIVLLLPRRQGQGRSSAEAVDRKVRFLRDGTRRGSGNQARPPVVAG
jgi:hypothetical protein